MKRIAIVHDPRFRLHDTGYGHPERPERLEAIDDALRADGRLDDALQIEPQPIARPLLEALHTPTYIERLATACQESQPFIDLPDSTICPKSYEIALLAAGATVQATAAVCTGEIDRAFCAVRPPGHHAENDRSMGFCMFNNAALAAHAARTLHELQRVLILDWDIHHGNGTQHAFYHDPDVLYVSLHGHPHYMYPGTGFPSEIGAEDGRGSTLNITFMPGAGDEDYRTAFLEHVEPAVRSFEPELMIISAGFDAHRDDPLGNTELSDGMYVEMLGRLLTLAQRSAAGRVVSVLEGGYNLEVLRRCVSEHVRMLAGDD